MRADPPTRPHPARLPFNACQGALGSSRCKRIDRIARGVNDPIHGISDFVSGMAGKILGKGITEELAAGSLGTAGEHLSPFKDRVRNGYRRFHTMRITKRFRGVRNRLKGWPRRAPAFQALRAPVSIRIMTPSFTPYKPQRECRIVSPILRTPGRPSAYRPSIRKVTRGESRDGRREPRYTRPGCLRGARSSRPRFGARRGLHRAAAVVSSHELFGAHRRAWRRDSLETSSRSSGRGRIASISCAMPGARITTA